MIFVTRDLYLINMCLLQIFAYFFGYYQFDFFKGNLDSSVYITA